MIFSFYKNILVVPITPPQSWPDITLTLFLAFIIGACIGSFVLAAALRLNRGEDIVRRPSRCRSCNRKLGWLQNMPILGWLSTMGRCRYCGTRFSMIYMLVEIIMGGLVALLFAYYAWPLATVLTIAITLMLICALTDLDAMLLHLPVMGLLGAIGFLISLFPFWPLSPLAALLGMVSVVLLITIINGIYTLLRGEAGFGSGDYWLLGAAGLWLGPVLAIALFFLAAFVGALIGTVMLIRKTGDGQTALPFGVFISLVFICWPILNILVILSL